VPLTVAEVKKLMQSCFPAGTEQYLDWDNPAANVSQFFTGAAGVWKTYGTDIVDTLRLEISPLTCTENIPVWESALGLSNTPLAMFGTTEQRRNQILSWLRQAGNNSLDDIRAVVQPYFLYDDPNDIVILETNRTTLRSLHTYQNLTPLPVLPNSTGYSYITVADDPRISPAGAHAYVNISATIEQVSFSLYGPGGGVVNFPAGWLGSGLVGPQQYDLFAPGLAGFPVRGTYVLKIDTGPAAFTLQNWALFVEGLGRIYDPRVPARDLNGLGAAMFYFAVVAEEDKLGTGYDLTGANRALQRLKPAHTSCAIIWQPTTEPDACAVPDTRSATPDAAIPCS